MYFQPSYGKARYQLPGGSNPTVVTVCRQPGVVYWPDVDPCNRPKGAVWQDNAMWAKYQRTGYLPLSDRGDGYYHPPVVVGPEGDKSQVSQEIETVPSDWMTYAKYAAVAVGLSLGFYVGYRAFRKKK